MANGKQLSQKGAEEILDIIDSYIDVKEAVTTRTCLNCNNQKCYIVYGLPKEKKKDFAECQEHHENCDWGIVFDCKNHNKWKE